MSFSSRPLLFTILGWCCLIISTENMVLPNEDLHWHENWAYGCDFLGNDITKVHIRGEDCGAKCNSTAECTHFAWDLVDGGTCWLKKGPVSKAQAIPASDIARICGVMETSRTYANAAPGLPGPPRLNGEKGGRGPPGHQGEKGEKGARGRHGEKGEPGNVAGMPNSVCLSSTKFDEHMSKMSKDTQEIKQQLATTTALQSTIEKLTTVIQQQADRTPCDSSTPRLNDSTAPALNFTPPTNVWCPWRSETCTQKIQRPGQMTIVMEQDVSLPFELHLSSSNNPANNSYVIHLAVDLRRVHMSKTVNGITTIINETTDRDYVLHEGKNKYWLSIDHVNQLVKYGQGEVRDRCTLLRNGISKAEKNSVRQIQFVHVSFSGSRILTDYKWYEYKVKLKIGQHPVVLDPPLVALEPKDRSLDHFLNNSFMLLSRLEHPCQSLYNDLIGWKFQDDAFAHLYEAIEHSIRNESGWCYKKLKEKSSKFGASNPRATYLRITVGLNAGTSPGVPFVLEIWPPGHYSPIHNHANTYGVIRVLYGEMNVKLYRALDLKKTKPIHEATLHENQVTWLSPGLNQVHKLENKSPNKTCITIQAYEYINDEVSHYEYFDYIDNSGSTIAKFEPVSDLDYTEFKALMIAEWNSRT